MRRIAESEQELLRIKFAGMIAILVVSLILGFNWNLLERSRQGHNDFLSFYAGAKLAFTDQLYNPVAVGEIQIAAAGVSGPSLRFIRLPHHAVILSPLGLLPFSVAYGVWQAINLAAVVLAVWLWPFRRDIMANLTALWFPLYVSTSNGQDLGLILLGIVLVMRTGSPLAFVLCLAKYHLMWSCWPSLTKKAIFQSVGIVMALLAVPCIWNPTWVAQYYQNVLLARALISQQPETLFASIGWFAVLLGAVASGIILAFCDRPLASAATIAIAVCVSPHAHFQDYTLLLPIIALCAERALSLLRSRARPKP